MTYINFLASWKKQDLTALKYMCSKNIEVFFVNDNNAQIKLNYSQLIELFERRFASKQDWYFEVIKQYSRGKENIVVITIIRESENSILLEPLALCILSFRNEKGKNELIRIYMETNLDS